MIQKKHFSFPAQDTDKIQYPTSVGQAKDVQLIEIYRLTNALISSKSAGVKKWWVAKTDLSQTPRIWSLSEIPLA